MIYVIDRDHPQVREIDMLHAADYSKIDLLDLQSKLANSKEKEATLAEQMLYVSFFKN